MTCLEKLTRANRWRLRAADPEHPSMLASTDEDGWNGTFIVPVNGIHWFVRLSDKDGWRHLHARSAQDHLLVKADILLALRRAFYADDACVVQYVGPDFLLDKPGFIHLWEPLEASMPVPIAAVTDHERPGTIGAD